MSPITEGKALQTEMYDVRHFWLWIFFQEATKFNLKATLHTIIDVDVDTDLCAVCSDSQIHFHGARILVESDSHLQMVRIVYSVHCRDQKDFRYVTATQPTNKQGGVTIGHTSNEILSFCKIKRERNATHKSNRNCNPFWFYLHWLHIYSSRAGKEPWIYINRAHGQVHFERMTEGISFSKKTFDNLWTAPDLESPDIPETCSNDGIQWTPMTWCLSILLMYIFTLSFL